MTRNPLSLIRRTFAALSAIAVCGTFMTSPVEAVVTPYFNDFSTSVSDFTETTDSQWALTGTGFYRNTIGASNTASSATLQVTDLGGPPATAKDWIISTRFTINSTTGTDTTVGLAALGSTAGLGTFYLGDVQIGEDDMRLVLVNPNNIKVDADTGFNVTTGIEYELAMTGRYVGTTLFLGLSLQDLVTPANTFSISTTFDATVGPQGQFFGIRNRTSGTSGTLNVDFNQLSVQTIVPEPTTMALGSLGMIVLAVRRRRRAIEA